VKDGRPSGSVGVETLRSLAALRGAESAWRAAVDVDPTRTIHVSFPWVRAWWETYGAGRDLCVILAREGDRVVGVAPFMIETRRIGGLGVTVLGLIANDVSPRSDIVLVDRIPDALDAILRAALARRWVYCDLGLVPASFDVIRWCQGRLDGERLSVRWRHTHSTPMIGLEGTWAEYLSNRSGSFRRTLHRAARKVGRPRVVTFPEDVDDFEEMVQKVLAISAETWSHRAGTSLAARPKDWDFFERLMREAHRDARLLVVFLGGYDAPMAFMILVGHHDVLYALKMGFRESFAAAEPGVNLVAECVQRAFRLGRWRRLDLDCAMERSDWKLRWATADDKVSGYYVFREGVLARGIEALYLGKRWATRAVRRGGDRDEAPTPRGRRA